MVEICKKEMCTGCGLCSRICPAQCIDLKENEEGFLYPVIDNTLCISCRRCNRLCPINHETEKKEALFHMAWHKDEDILKKSSSGGVFSALANYVFERKGIVFGAAVDFHTHGLSHIGVEDKNSLGLLRFSKYYQSNASESYLRVKEFLSQGRWVLFTGTACQIAALLSCLKGQSRERLITMDILCHGVTSQKVVDSYLKSKEKHYKKTITEYYFRVKTDEIWWGKGGTSMRLVFEDGSDAYEHISHDTFFECFNRNVCLREGCYRCKYCGGSRVSDFTAADFWGIDPKTVPEKQMKYGVSVLLVNSEQGRSMLPELKKQMEIKEIDSRVPVLHNRAFVEPNQRPHKRDVFFTMLDKKDFDKIIHRLFALHYIELAIKGSLKKIIGENNYNTLKNLYKNRKSK